MKVEGLDPSKESRWEAFVAPRAQAVTDLLNWRDVVASTYGIPMHGFLAESENRVSGTLGLYEIRHPLFGHYLVTAPFGNDGGMHYETPDARDALLARAKSFAEERKVDYLLLRTREAPFKGFEVDEHYRSAVLDLDPDPDAVWMGALRAKTRNQVRRGQREGFVISEGPDELSAFHEVFLEHMRDLGSPAHGVDLYRNIHSLVGERARFIVIRDGGELAGGALVLDTDRVAMNLHTVSLRRYNRRCPNYALYWYMIETACERGLQHFDMGRSEVDSPHLSFKQHWGAQPVELSYNYHLVKAKTVPRVDPRNPRYRLPVAAWQKLPLSLAGAIGPWLIRGIA